MNENTPPTVGDAFFAYDRALETDDPVAVKTARDRITRLIRYFDAVNIGGLLYVADETHGFRQATVAGPATIEP